MNTNKSRIIRIISMVMLLAMVLLSVASCAEKPLYYGKTIILHSNDVHGALTGYSYMYSQKEYFESNGANVYVVDAGDFSSGNLYASYTKGKDVVTLMNDVGYDVVALGNHDFDFGYEQLKSNLAEAKFSVICADIFEDGKTLFDPNIVLTNGKGSNKVKIGLFALDTPEIQQKVNPNLVKDFTFVSGDDLYKVAQNQVDELSSKSDLVICIAHLGVDESSGDNTSIKVMNNTNGIDFIIDAHSHTVMTEGPNSEPIQSTGTAFANIGVVVIDNKTKTIEDHYLVNTEDCKQDPVILEKAQKIIAEIDEKFGTPIAKSEVFMPGDKTSNRAKESSMGDLANDAARSYVIKNCNVKVDADHVVAVVNGGSIRAELNIGDISRKDINMIFPFGNTLSVNYVTGAVLLEILEASTFCTPENIGGFPQISGMKVIVDTSVEFDQGDLYPQSTYYKPNSIKRVTIESVNGNPFDINATYVIATTNFCSAGGDTYYALAESFNAGNGFDTSIPIDDVIVDYIVNDLDGVIGFQYAEPQGRLIIK